MVPQQYTAGVTCDEGSGTLTATDDHGSDAAAKTLQGYWNLIGVVAGSPPFSANQAEGTQVPEISNVVYGTDASTAVSHSTSQENTVLQSSAAKARIGLKRLDLEPQYSRSYAHAWRSENLSTTTTTTELSQTVGTSTFESDQDGMGE